MALTKDTKALYVDSISIYNIGNSRCWLGIKRYYAMNFNHFEMEPHKHNEFEIMYVASGNCKIFFWRNDFNREDDNREEFILKEGEYVLVDCNILHEMEVTKGTQCRILNLEISILPDKGKMCLPDICKQSKSFKNLLQQPVPIFKGYDETGNLHTIITEVHKQLQNPVDASEELVMQNLIMAQFLIEIARQRDRKYNGESGSKYVRKTLNYLSSHFDEELKVRDIAKEVGISPAYLQRLFKEQTKVTLVDKINELRIEKAKLLLETSHMPIIDIGVDVGFNNRQHFTYTFQKLTGSSPAIYRKHKGNYRVWEGF
jgi:AraC family transcriptional regulator, melibiose operon regulatory protein